LDSTQRTSLHIASNYGHRDICVYLLSSGSKINTRDNYGYTPLFLSLLKHHFEVADDLILFHGEVNLKRSNGMGILHEACSKGDVEIIQWTLDQKGIKYNLKDTNGETPLMKCSTSAPPEFIYNFMNIKEVDILGVDESGRNILHFCIIHHRVDFLHFLGSKLSDMNLEDERRIPFKEMLIQSDIISKQTPLHLAVAYEKLTCVLSLTSLMVLLDCPFHKKDKKNMSAYDVSKEKYILEKDKTSEKNEEIVQIYEYLLSMKKKKNIFK
jgi:ankyrin repeat protein